MGYKLLGCFWQFSLELLWSVILKLKSNLSLAISCFVCTKMKQSLQLPWRKAIAVHRITFARVWAAATEKKILCQFSKKKVTPLQGHSFGGCAQKWHGTRMGTYHKFPSVEGISLGLCSMFAAEPRKELEVGLSFLHRATSSALIYPSWSAQAEAFEGNLSLN